MFWCSEVAPAFHTSATISYAKFATAFAPNMHCTCTVCTVHCTNTVCTLYVRHSSLQLHPQLGHALSIHLSSTYLYMWCPLQRVELLGGRTKEYNSYAGLSTHQFFIFSLYTHTYICSLFFMHLHAPSDATRLANLLYIFMQRHCMW